VPLPQATSMPFLPVEMTSPGIPYFPCHFSGLALKIISFSSFR